MKHLMDRGLFHLIPESVVLVGTVTTDGSADPTISDFPGVASVARATNRYTLTLDDPYNSLLFAVMCPAGSAPETAQATGTDVTTSTGGTVAFDSGGTHVSTTLYFLLVLKNSADAF